jgi:hypothetical protein
MTDPKPTDTPEPADPLGTPEPADAIEPLDATDAPEGGPEWTPDAEEVEPVDADEVDADEADALEAEEAGDADAAPIVAGAVGGVRRRGVVGRAPARAQTPSEVAVHIDDRVSAAFVVAVAIVFVAILGWGLLAGHGGFLTAKPSPTPAASVSASPSASVSASPSAEASASGSAVPSAASPAASASAVVSPSPSGS